MACRYHNIQTLDNRRTKRTKKIGSGLIPGMPLTSSTPLDTRVYRPSCKVRASIYHIILRS